MAKAYQSGHSDKPKLSKGTITETKGCANFNKKACFYPKIIMTGQIIKRGENTWYVRIFLGRDANGKRRYFNKTIHGTKKDAQKFLTAKVREKDLGNIIEPTSLTLNQFIDRWLEVAVRPRVSQRTADGYKSLLERYIKNPLGQKKIEELHTLDIQKVYAQMQEKGLSARIVGLVRYFV